MSKLELSEQIARDLLDKDCLNVADFPSTKELLEAATDTILYRLGNYAIVIGEIF